MKKTIAIVALLCASACLSQAQTLRDMFTPVEFTVGMDVRGGVNISNMVYVPYASDQYALDRMPGFNVGANLSFQFLEGLAVETGLGLTSRGGKDNLLGNKYFPVYLRVPLVLSLKVGVVDDVQAYINLGCYGAVGTFGNVKSGRLVMDFFGNGLESLARRPDAGLCAGFGVTLMDQLRIGFLYEYGLVDIANDPTRKGIGSFYNSAMSFQIGYVLF